MIEYKKTTWKEHIGEHKATLVGIDKENNNFYDKKDANSTEKVLTLTFEVEDPDTMEMFEHVQKFVKPLTGGNGLFQQLLDAIGFMEDLESGEFDETKLAGLKLIITMGKNKKGYANIEKAVLDSNAKNSTPKKKANKVNEEEIAVDDLPF